MSCVIILPDFSFCKFFSSSSFIESPVFRSSHNFSKYSTCFHLFNTLHHIIFYLFILEEVLEVSNTARFQVPDGYEVSHNSGIIQLLDCRQVVYKCLYIYIVEAEIVKLDHISWVKSSKNKMYSCFIINVVDTCKYIYFIAVIFFFVE